MDAPAPRHLLTSLELTGRRRALRRAVLALLVAGAVVQVVTFFVASHRVPSHAGYGASGDWHGYADDLSPVIAVGPVIALMTLAWARRGGFPRGMLAGVVTAATTFVLLAGAVFAHLLSDVEGNAADGAFLVTSLGLLAAGTLLFLGEVLLYLAERRHRRRDVDPVFPAARVVRGAGG